MKLMTSGGRVLAVVPLLLAVTGAMTAPSSATSPVTPELLIAGEDNGPADDELRFKADESLAGEVVVLHLIRGTKNQGNKRLVAVLEAVIPEEGELTFVVKDRNRNRTTRFVAKATLDELTYTSNTQKVR